MRAFIFLGSILMGLVAWLTVAVGQARADISPNEQQFLTEVRAAGFDKPDNIALRDGFLVCSLSEQSGSNNDLINSALRAAQRILHHEETPELDAQFTNLAETYLCGGVNRG